MNLHEYQGKQLFAEYGLPVSKGYAVDTPEEAVAAAEKIGGEMWVVKAQVHAGGRGKAGGVKLVKETAGGNRGLCRTLAGSTNWLPTRLTKRDNPLARFWLKPVRTLPRSCISARLWTDLRVVSCSWPQPRAV